MSTTNSSSFYQDGSTVPAPLVPPPTNTPTSTNESSSFYQDSNPTPEAGASIIAQVDVAEAAAQAAAVSAQQALTNISIDLASYLLKASNLSDLASVPTARTNLGLVASATTDTTNASNISSGTLPNARLPDPTTSALGGVESASAPSHNYMTGINTTGQPTFAQPSASDVTGLVASATTDTTNASNISSGTLPAARLPVPTASTLGGVESATAPSNEFCTGINTSGVPQFAQPSFSNLAGVASSAQIPAPTASTLGGVESSTAPSNTFATGISTGGVVAYTQPAFSNLSGSVAAGQMPALTGAVTTTAGAVATTLSANAVANSNLATAANGTIKSNISGSTATPSDNSISSVLDALFGTTQGQIVYRGSSGWNALSPGTSGYVLQTGGASANPSWTPASTASAFTGDTGSGGVQGLVPAPPAGSAAAGAFLGAGGSFTLPSYGGFTNAFRNGAMEIWQRGTGASVATTGSYGPDGWIVLPTGAAISYAQAPGSGQSMYSLQLLGAASVTAVVARQRIESYLALRLTNQQVTVQALVYNQTGAALTPTLSVGSPTTQDTYSAVGNANLTNILNNVNLQSCANLTWTRVAYTFPSGSTLGNGLEVNFNFGALTSGKNVQICGLDIRITPNVTTGQNSNPPAPELRPIVTELNVCQRYFQSSYNDVAPGTATSVGELSILAVNGYYFYTLGFVQLPVTMRAVPTYTMYSPHTGTAGNMYDNNTGADLSGVSFSPANPGSFYVLFPSGGMTLNYTMSGQWTASAEL